jgi:preprotein translocase subunit Sss1
MILKNTLAQMRRFFKLAQKCAAKKFPASTNARAAGFL